MSNQPLREVARGRWKGILPHFGIPSRFLEGRQGPCPLCGGRDRARFDDLEGRGTWICNHCGAGDGIKLIELKTGLPFAEIAKQVEELAGAARIEKPRKPRSDDQYHAAMSQAWTGANPVEEGDPVSLWIRSRVGDIVIPPTLRFAPSCFHADTETYHPAMLAKMHGPNDVAVMVHRTYLTTGGRKADVASVRMTMPGRMPDGSAVRLARRGPVMGVSTGIETSLAAMKKFGLPVWATLNDTMLEKWTPPPGTERVIIFGDHDASFSGQAASFVLAKRLTTKEFATEVRIPGITVDSSAIGKDWNDMLEVA